MASTQDGTNTPPPETTADDTAEKTAEETDDSATQTAEEIVDELREQRLEGQQIEDAQIDQIELLAADELAEEQKADEREALRRALRDLEAANERVKRNAERVYQEARGALVADLFPVLDDLDRSIEAARSHSDPALLEGVQMIRKELDDVLVRYGAERIDASPGSFDPNVQEAVATEKVSDPGKNFTVLEQLAPGYRYGDRLLRPAKVIVGVYHP